MTKCPFCAEWIQDAAILCRFCRERLVPAAQWPHQPPHVPAVHRALADPSEPAPRRSPESARTYDQVLRKIHACISSPRCADAGEGGWPAPPHGRARLPIDILLVGWNPQIDGYPAVPASFDAWREDGAGGLERAVRAKDAWTRRIGGLIPPEIPLASGRIVNTRVWKWPSKGKSSAPAALAQARACASCHLDDEREALRPRAIVTYDKHAAEFFAEAARERRVEIQPGPSDMEYVVGWALPSSRWGHDCGLILLKGRQVAYPKPTREWCVTTLRSMIGAQTSQLKRFAPRDV